MARSKRSPRFVSGLIGVVILVLSVILMIYTLNSSKGLPGVARTYVTMKFKDTGDIKTNADLREADVRVGRVNTVEYQGDGVGTIEAQFDDERPIYNNASAMIVSRSGLGQKYVNINRGTPETGVAPSGAIIGIDRTEPTVEILSLADIFDPKTSTAVGSAVEQLGAGLAGNGDALSQAVDSVPMNLPRLATVARALNQNNGADINQLLGSLRSLTSRFQGRQQQLTDLNRQLAVTLDAVNADGGQALANLVKTAPPAFVAVRGALNDVNEPLEITRDAVRNLRPGVRDLAAATPDVRGVLREAPEPLRKVPGVSEVGQPALEALTPALRDLRPVVPKLRTLVENGRTPLKCLALFDVTQFLTRFGNILRTGEETGNFGVVSVVPEMRLLSGGVLAGLGGTALPNEVQVERPCFKESRQGATTNVQPPVVPGYQTPAYVPPLTDNPTPVSPAGYKNGGK